MRLDIKRWGLENPAQKLLLDRQYRKTQRYKRTQSEYLKRWRPSNKHIVNAAHARRRAQQLRAIPIWFEADQVKEVYNQANRLSKLFGKRFHVDHIIPLMNPTVCGLHCWHNLQVLDAQLNLNKTNSYQHDW
jgi:ribosomal protein S4